MPPTAQEATDAKIREESGAASDAGSAITTIIPAADEEAKRGWGLMLRG